MSRSLNYEQAIDAVRILHVLAEFDPRVVGTLPIGLAVEGSDIDIVCHASDPDHFADMLWRHFRDAPAFSMYRWTTKDRPTIVRFERDGWPFEIFGGCQPVDEQLGWRHFAIERRLLALDDGRLKEKIMRLRSRGAKTEPAFAAALGVEGNAYSALLAFESCTDADLQNTLNAIQYT